MSTPTPDQSATDPAFNAREQSSTLRQMDNQPVPETQAHINQRSHTGAIPAAKYETVGAPFDEPPSMSTIPREVPRAGPYQLDTTYTCSQAGLQECIKDLAACETARAKLAAENAALHKERLDWVEQHCRGGLSFGDNPSNHMGQVSREFIDLTMRMMACWNRDESSSFIFAGLKIGQGKD